MTKSNMKSLNNKPVGEKKHIHTFIHNGGGMILTGKELPCDDTYLCECGEKITILSNFETQQQLPEIIIGELKEEEEIDEKYKEEIIKNLPN